MRLARPYIPVAVRVQVAERQCNQMGWTRDPGDRTKTLAKWLDAMLMVLFGECRSELHHRPALVNRRQYRRVVNGKLKTFYDPPANDPDHLVYMPKDDHDIETRVRGQGAQRSDLAQRRYQKRLDANRATGAPRRPKFAPRKLRGASRWPKGRKIRSREHRHGREMD